MGCYINPGNETKEAFLQREGRVISVNEATITEDEYPVCLVNNGPFTAAAVGFSMSEVAAFSRSDDRRPKVWFMVRREKLLGVSDLAEYEHK